MIVRSIEKIACIQHKLSENIYGVGFNMLVPSQKQNQLEQVFFLFRKIVTSLNGVIKPITRFDSQDIKQISTSYTTSSELKI